jgi:hypothetical protein
MLAYVELGVRFTRTYGDIDAPFYRSMESMYASALHWIVKHGMRDAFGPRAEAIVTATQGMGWWFHDTLADTFDRWFETDEFGGESNDEPA